MSCCLRPCPGSIRSVPVPIGHHPIIPHSLARTQSQLPVLGVGFQPYLLPISGAPRYATEEGSSAEGRGLLN